jgi:hypothetical protein
MKKSFSEARQGSCENWKSWAQNIGQLGKESCEKQSVLKSFLSQLGQYATVAALKILEARLEIPVSHAARRIAFTARG